MAVLLVRHANAGDRDRWDAPDDLRPLTTKGQIQADGLVGALAAFAVTRVFSSPYLRCSQTVAPRAALALARSLLGTPGYTVLCTHGDVVEEVLDGFGVRREDDTRKGATWALDEAGAQGLPPPT